MQSFLVVLLHSNWN